MRLITTLLLLVIAGCDSTNNLSRHDMTENVIYFIPFSVETFSPVTAKTIENDANCSIKLEGSRSEYLDLMELLASESNGGFDYKRVRLKIYTIDADVFLVDANGVVLRNGKLKGSLSQKKLENITSIIDSLAKSMGISCE